MHHVAVASEVVEWAAMAVGEGSVAGADGAVHLANGGHPVVVDDEATAATAASRADAERVAHSGTDGAARHAGGTGVGVVVDGLTSATAAPAWHLAERASHVECSSAPPGQPGRRGGLLWPEGAIIRRTKERLRTERLQWE
jgi:hypothetical protein